MTTYKFLTDFVSAYSVFAIVFIIWHIYHYYVVGVPNYSRLLNEKFADNRYLIIFQIVSYLTLAGWFALALPWLDLFTFHRLTTFTDHGIMTYFGEFKGRAADIYFIVMFANILAVKAALNLIDCATLLRRGRIRLVPTSFFGLVWKQE